MTFWRDILVIHLFVSASDRPPIRPGVSNITVDCLQDFSCSSTSDGSTLECLLIAFFVLAFSGQVNSAFSSLLTASRGFCHDPVQNTGADRTWTLLLNPFWTPFRTRNYYLFFFGERKI